MMQQPPPYHEEWHIHAPAPGEFTINVGKLGVVSASTSSAITSGAFWLDWSRFPPTVKINLLG